MEQIFVQIASYRDPELAATIESCLDNAVAPQRLTFGICEQFDDVTENQLARYRDDPRFRIDSLHHSESHGCCWARNRTNKLYAGETYTLQIDAHMRFADRWDERLIAMLGLTGSDKPILTTYPPAYSLQDGEAVTHPSEEIQKLALKRLNLDLTTTQHTVLAPDRSRPGSTHGAGGR